jgi:alpha-mannosidase
MGSETGLISQIDAGGGRECLEGPLLRALVVDDDGDSWGSDRWSYRTIVGEFQKESGPTVLHAGPIRTITQSVFTFGRSRIVVDTYAYPQWPVLEFRLRITWNEIRRRLKLSIPTVFKVPSILCDVPGGAIARPADGEEHVHGRWCMLQGQRKGRETAFALVNNGQHGLDFHEGEIRLSVLRSAAYCHEQGFPLGSTAERKYMDIGEHDVRLAVTAGEPKVVRGLLAGLPDFLTAPPLLYAHLPIGIPRAKASHPEGRSRKLLSMDQGTVRMLCCKRSRDAEALVIRLQETSGKPSRIAIHVTDPAVTMDLTFRPFEIKTLRLERTGTWREVDLIEEH